MKLVFITIGENHSTLEKNFLMIKGLTKNDVNVYPIHFTYNIKNFFTFLRNYNAKNYNWKVVGWLFKGNTKFKKFINNIKLSIKFYITLKNINKKSKIDFIISSRECITELWLILKIFSKLYSIPLVINIMEYTPALPDYKKEFRYKIRWKLALNFSDAFIVISKWLNNKLSQYNKPILYLPVIFDPQMIDNFIDKISQNFLRNNSFHKNHILIFSSSNAYTDLLYFTLKALSHLKNYDFLFVITGNYTEEQKNYWQNVIKSLNLEDKIVFSGYLTEKEFFALIKKSTALLIPLLNTDKHKARFPQKILDYIYLEKPIISTKVGEIAEHFIDEETAFLDDTITPKGYSQKIKFVLDNPQEAIIVAKNAKIYILENFHFLKSTKYLKFFLLNNFVKYKK